MTRGMKYLPTILVAVFMLVFFLSKDQQERKFKNEIRKIDRAREALRVQVDSLTSVTRERDLILSKILKRNLEIIDTLNVIQKTLDKNKRDIDQKIEQSKEVIDEYWKTN